MKPVFWRDRLVGGLERFFRTCLDGTPFNFFVYSFNVLGIFRHVQLKYGVPQLNKKNYLKTKKLFLSIAIAYKSATRGNWSQSLRMVKMK